MPKNEARDIPDEWRESVARHVAKWVAANAPDKNTREVAELLKMKQPTYVQLKNKKGSFGLHLLLQLREAIGVPIDELMGLPSVKGAAPPPPRTRAEMKALAVEVAALIREGEATSSPASESQPARPDRDSAPAPAPRRRPRD